MSTGSRVSRTLAPRSKVGDSNTTRKDRRSHWTGSRPPSSQSNWLQGRIQCRKILDQTATEDGVTSVHPWGPMLSYRSDCGSQVHNRVRRDWIPRPEHVVFFFVWPDSSYCLAAQSRDTANVYMHRHNR